MRERKPKRKAESGAETRRAKSKPKHKTPDVSRASRTRSSGRGGRGR